jgi:hypothetical protein
LAAKIAAVFDEAAIGQLVHTLERREASLWHACQLIDLGAYLALGGIGSRAELERRELTFTPLASDPRDRRSGHAEQVFFHLDDLGHGFAAGWRMTPNLFGPIALQVAPAALSDANDATVCLRSPSTTGFGRADQVTDVAAVDELFLHDASVGFPWSSFVLYGKRLRDTFNAPHAGTIEVLASPKRRRIDLRHVVAVWVDPVELDDAQLIDVVVGLSEKLEIPLRIRRRTMLQPERRDVWRDVVRLIRDGEKPLIQLMNRADASPAFRDWARELHVGGLDWIWDPFVRYLRDGTLHYLAAPRRAPEPTLLNEESRPGFGSAQRRGHQAGTSPAATPVELPRPAVRACGHLARSWDNGVCYVCIGQARSRWRYDG